MKKSETITKRAASLRRHKTTRISNKFVNNTLISIFRIDSMRFFVIKLIQDKNPIK